jgi:soluble lytic murein transglycosylase-like protein
MHDEGTFVMPSAPQVAPAAFFTPPAASVVNAPTAPRIPSPDGRHSRPASSAAPVSSPSEDFENARRAGHRRAAPSKSLLRGNTAITATAALGAVVTGGLMATQPAASNAVAEASETGTHTDLAAVAALPVSVRPVSDGATIMSATNFADSASSATAMLPVTVPADRENMVDQRDIEALHKGESLAAQASAAHAVAAKEASVLSGGGDLDDWIDVALSKLNLDASLSNGVRQIIMKESKGNPNAVNLSDSNALAGRPSRGLMQVIPSTFRAYVLPELAHQPITNPVANITAGIRYMLANYGLSTLRAGGRSDRSGNYVGY